MSQWCPFTEIELEKFQTTSPMTITLLPSHDVGSSKYFVFLFQDTGEYKDSNKYSNKSAISKDRVLS